MDSGDKLTGMTPKVKSAIPYGFALLSGLLLALSFPRFELYLLSWIAFIPLFFAIQNQSAVKSFLLGCLSGLSYFAGTLSWLAMTMHDFGGLPTLAAVGINLLLIAYLALYIGLFSLLIHLLTKVHKAALMLMAPVFWVLLEYAKGHMLSGFPWVSLAYSQYRNLPMIQIADFGSIYAVAFVIVLINAAIYLFILKSRSEGLCLRSISPLIVGLAVLLFTFSYGQFRLSQISLPSETVSVSVIQGNTEQSQKWDRPFRELTVEKYLSLSKTTLQNNQLPRPNLIIWPESALPFIFGSEADQEKRLIDFVKKEKLGLIVGAPSITRATNMPPSEQISLFNSAFLLTPDEGIASRYDKMHLVPFGEYVPFSKLFFFAKKIVSGISDFSPGDTALVMSSGKNRIGVAICYEIIFPDLVRQFVKNGADIMTTITNDAWFGNSSAPHQHFSMMVFRAIENRVPFARAANTGISGFIDAQGRITTQSELGIEAALTEDLTPGDRSTFYTLQGDVFVTLCAMIAAIFFVNIFIKRRTNNVF